MTTDKPSAIVPGLEPAGAGAGRGRAWSRILLAIGGSGSFALMLYAGRRNPSLVLKLLFTGWVLSPFAGLAWADLQSTRWPSRVQHALTLLTIAAALGSLVIYGADALRPPRAQAAFAFVAVPPVTWLIGLVWLALSRNGGPAGLLGALFAAACRATRSED